MLELMSTHAGTFSRAACAAMLLLAAAAAADTAPPAPATHSAYSDDEVAKAACDFFRTGAQDLSEVLAKVLKEEGQPVAIIRGEEAGGAIGVGVRYGRGELIYKGLPAREVYWQGPSIGFDVGANARSATTRCNLSVAAK